MKNILTTTVKIKAEYPELTKYLDEVPFHNTSPNHKGINSKDLTDYSNTLNDLLKSYSKAHEHI